MVMKKRIILIIIFSFGLFGFSSKVESSRRITPAVAFLCGAHPRLGADSKVNELDRLLLEKILRCDKQFCTTVIINEDLEDFDGLLERLGNDIVTRLDFSCATDITDDQLCRILELIGHSLKELKFLLKCKHLSGFISEPSNFLARCLVKYCPVLEELDLGMNFIGEQFFKYITQSMLFKQLKKFSHVKLCKNNMSGRQYQTRGQSQYDSYLHTQPLCMYVPSCLGMHGFPDYLV